MVFCFFLCFCTSSLSYVYLVLSSVRLVCCVTWLVCWFWRAQCFLWSLVGYGVCWCVFLVFVLFSWCVMCVTVFCFVFAGFVFLDSTNSFFVAYVTIFCVR